MSSTLRKPKRKPVDNISIGTELEHAAVKITISDRVKLTDKQKQIRDLIIDNSRKKRIIFLTGASGTTKTFMAVYLSLHLMNMGKIDELLYYRSVVESTDNKIGFLPGDEKEKLNPYMEPLFQKLTQIISETDIKKLEKENKIKYKHIGFARGTEWDYKSIILDEAQNMTIKELITLSTRIKDSSFVFILGDLDQCDIGNKSGLTEFMSYFEENEEEANEQGIHFFHFTEDDIVRSEIVKYIVKKISQFKITKNGSVANKSSHKKMLLTEKEHYNQGP